MEDALLQNPLIPVYGEDGSYGGPTGAGLQDKWNPLAILYINKDNKQKTWRTFGNLYADVNIVDGLKFSTKFNFDYNRFKFDEQTASFNQNGSTLGNIFIDGGENYQRFARNRNDRWHFYLPPESDGDIPSSRLRYKFPAQFRIDW